MSAYVPIVDSILDVRELTVSSAGYTDSFPRLLRPTARALRDRIEPVLALIGLQGRRGTAAGVLAHGEKQWLERRPQLLLLDEPTEGIQPSIMEQIEDLIRSLREGGRTSILLVEQYLDFALNVGNYFYVMETGTIVMHGSMSEFDTAAARDYLAV